MSDILNTLDNFSTATDIVKAIKEAEYRGYMKAVAERPQGKWIVRFPYEDTGKTRTCSNCNITQTVNVYDGAVRFKFCPYCGAMMKGADDE